MTILFTGATGLPGSLLLAKIAAANPGTKILCLVRNTSNKSYIEKLDLDITYFVGDTSDSNTWDNLLKQYQMNTIVHIATINHLKIILDSLKNNKQNPRLIVIGSTGVYSKYRQASQLKQQMEDLLNQYSGSWCLLRPTMIYGSDRDKNIHKLIKFCDRYGFFPLFGSGKSLLQPVHAEDIAQALFSALSKPEIQGAYDLSGGSIITFRDLILLVGKLLDKTVRLIPIPLSLGVQSATILEELLGSRSLVRSEQILRLQEDKAYPHDRAQRDLEFLPRTLEVGLQEEIELMRSKGII